MHDLMTMDLPKVVPEILTEEFITQGYVEMGGLYKEDIGSRFFTHRRLAVPGHEQYWENIKERSGSEFTEVFTLKTERKKSEKQTTIHLNPLETPAYQAAASQLISKINEMTPKKLRTTNKNLVISF